MSSKDAAPVDENLFAQLDPPLLGGGVCDHCGVVVFPSVARCPGCAGAHMTRRPLPDRGTVWTWTTQSFPPKPPFEEPDSGFEPYVVGYVDLGSVLVESRIVGNVEIGDEVRLRVLAVNDSEFTYAFERLST